MASIRSHFGFFLDGGVFEGEGACVGVVIDLAAHSVNLGEVESAVACHVFLQNS